MATILLTWELGGGLGHLVNLLPFAEGLQARGHRVIAALRDLSSVERIFGHKGVSWFQAPIKTKKSANHVSPTRSFAHILHNNGFGSEEELRVMVRAWRGLFDAVAPDAIIFDHSPTALLAARTCSAKRILVGTGFFCPLDDSPLPDLRPWLPPSPDRLLRDERHVLANSNRVLQDWSLSPLTKVSQLYHPVDENFLATFPELDHYPSRSGTQYWGAWPNVGGREPEWPRGDGKKVYAYLKPFPAQEALLDLLVRLRCPTIIYSTGVSAKLRQRYQSELMCFVDAPLDLSLVGQECDLAIVNGNHGTTVSLLMAGIPTLQIPIYLEQAIFASRVEQLGCAICARPNQPTEISSKLMQMLQSPGYRVAAGLFARRHKGFSPQRQIQGMLDRVEQLVARGDRCISWNTGVLSLKGSTHRTLPSKPENEELHHRPDA